MAASLPGYMTPLLAVSAVLLASVWRGKRRGDVILLASVCLASVLYFKWHDASYGKSLIHHAQRQEALYVQGQIDSEVERDGDIVRFYLMAERVMENQRERTLEPKERLAVRLKLSEEGQVSAVQEWHAGQLISGKFRLIIPEGARNPHAFDYARYLRWQGVYAIAEANFQAVKVTGRPGLTAITERWRHFALQQVHQIFDPEHAGYMASLLLGLQAQISPELESVYADLGALHVLAISGLHVAIVSQFFLWIVEKMGVTRERALQTCILFIALYVLLVGASASAMRAGLMGGIMLAAQYARTSLAARTSWSLALMLMLLADPYQLWHTGFQLSFLVTLGLIEWTPLLLRLSWCRWTWLRSLAAVTLTAQLVSFPVLIHSFHLFSPISALVNLVFVPVLSAVVLPAGYVALVLAFLHPALAVIPVVVVEAVLSFTHTCLFALEKLPVPFRHWPHPHVYWLCLYGLFLILVPLLWRNGYHRRRDLLGYGLCLLLLLVAARQPFSGRDEVRITFLDVGQGDSVVVEVGKKTVYLIDGGGTIGPYSTEAWRKRRDPFEVGKDVVLPFLRARGIERIDMLVMTHGDADHVAGLERVIPYFPVGMALGLPDDASAVQQRVLALLQEKGVPLVRAKPNATWSERPGVQWRWLHPGPASPLSGNDGSIVLQLEAFGRSVLFTGDLQEAGERILLQAGLIQNIDVLKVGHHGSRTSTTEAFLHVAKPEVAVISAGRNNRYGHPSVDVLERLQQAGAAIYRTDVNGAVTLTIQADKWAWNTQRIR